MQLSGYRLKNYNLYGIDAILDCPTLNIFEGISLVIDTGANSTILNAIDMILLNIEYQRLTPVREDEGVVSIEGNSENIETFRFPQSKLVFVDQDNKEENIEEDLDRGYAIRNKVNYSLLIEDLRWTRSISLDSNPLPSVLGIDILREYELTFDYTNAMLRPHPFTYHNPTT